MSSRTDIVKGLVTIISQINGTAPYKTKLFSQNVTHKLKFWDEVMDFPYVCVVAGYETREYLPSAFKWGYLNVAIKLYVHGENALEQLEELITDVELAISDNERFEIGDGNATTEILVTSIVTDEGLLTPYGVGEINVQVRYPA